jgi:hypothetical protein
VVGITWIFCAGHAGVCGNEEADKLAVLAPIGGQLLHDRKDVIKGLSDKAWKESKDRKPRMLTE